LRNKKMNSSPADRIIDSNLNRLAEGLRVLEDIARMVLDDVLLTRQLKNLRHDLVRGDLAFNLEFLRSRDSAGDVGADLEVAGDSKAKDLPLIAVANSRRAQESLRVLEEIAKLPEISSKMDSEKFKKARFELYTLEQVLVSRLARMEKVKKVSGLYVIIDTPSLGGRSHIEAALDVIRAGVTVVQLRDKTTEKKKLIPLAREVQDACRKNGVLFIMNDYLDVALVIEADGLHIGQEDLPVEAARKLLPIGKILGCSVNTVEQAVEAEAAGADYIAVGSIFPTATKDNIHVVGLERLRQVRQRIKKPLVAIGGINKDNARETIEAGADSICVISAVLGAEDIFLAAREIMDEIKGKDEKTN
jgi:thiamine-phosphate pyrophosphorylase